MNSAEQRDEELVALNRFRERSGELLGAERRGDDPPDFVIEMDHGRVTVELTRYHQDAGGPRGSALALQESAERKLRARAQELFEHGHPDVRVSISVFFHDGALRKENIGRYAEKLAALVATLMPPAPTEAEPITTREATWPELDAVGLGRAIVVAAVWRWQGMTASDWRVHPGGTLSGDTAHLLSRIREKERDLERYQRPGEESWLIVYAPPLLASGFFDLAVLSPGMFESTFDTVVFLDVVWGQFVKVAHRREPDNATNP